jgi:hypothetical protein
MNIKVVLIWAFVVIVCFGIGIFGYVNRDLIVSVNDTDSDTKIEQVEYTSKSCYATTSDATVTYTFRINPSSNQIERLFVKYEAKSENLDAYVAAANINQTVNDSEIYGVNTQLYGTSSDVVLNLNVNLLEYDSNAISELNTDLSTVNMLVDHITDYSSYQNAINSSLGLTFNCD